MIGVVLRGGRMVVTVVVEVGEDVIVVVVAAEPIST